MSLYTKSLHRFINRNGFVRCFYGKCPECGERIFSIGDEVIDNNKIKAKFVCECGKKYKETVYSGKLKKYKYPQALCEIIRDKKFGEIKVLSFRDRYYLVTPDKIRSKPIKPYRKET